MIDYQGDGKHRASILVAPNTGNRVMIDYQGDGKHRPYPPALPVLPDL